MNKPPKYKGYSFYDYWDRDNQKITLDLKNYAYYFEKPANPHQENLIYHEIPYNPEFFLSLIKKVKKKAIKIQFKDEDIQKYKLKNSFLSIWEQLPSLQPSRLDKLLDIFRKKILSGSLKKEEATVGIMLFLNQLWLFQSKSNNCKKKGYWNKLYIIKDSEAYIRDKFDFSNFLRAGIIRFEHNKFFLTLYEYNSEVSKSHANFWGLKLSYVEQVRAKVWERDKGICQECYKKVYEINLFDPIKEIEVELVKIKEIKTYKWKRKCWKCHKEIPRVTYHLSLGNGYSIGDIEKLDTILMEKYSFVKKTYSYARGEQVIANTCLHCGALQGNFYVIHEDFIFLCNEDIENLIDTVIPNNLTIEDLGIHDRQLEYELEYEVIHSWGHIHHKDGNRHNNDLSNLMLLCDKCHAKKKKNR